jgi:hypothetical protein
MMQFYFLSILLNAAAGGLLLSDASGAPGSSQEGYSASPLLPAFLERDTPRLVLGALTMVTGFFKLLSPTRGDIPVIGDLLSAGLGLVTGFVLVFQFYRKRASLEDEKTERFSLLIEKNKKFIGIVALASAALHFFFPGVLFL